MKRENCVQVNNVNKLSVSYLRRFFGSVGPIAKIQKNETSKYVTIQFVNKSCVDKVFRYEGRILDEQPIKINRLKHSEIPELNISNSEQADNQKKTSLQLRDELFCSNGSQQELFLQIRDELKPHRIDQNERLIISILIWRLADQLSTEIKHLKNYNINMRSSYLKLELQKLIIQRINNKNIVPVSENMRSVIVHSNNAEALVWYSVPYPNTEEEQTKIEAASLLGKCISTIRNHLSIRIADNLSKLFTASLCFNLQQNQIDKIINLDTNLATSYDDNFEGIVQNIGAKDIFFELLGHHVPNSCVQLRQDKILQCFQCTLRLQCPKLTELKEQSWCHFYRAQLCRRLNAENQEVFYLKNKHKIYSIKLEAETLAFESCQFSLFRVGKEIMSYKSIFQDNSNVQIVYVTKQSKPEKTTQFKKIYQDTVLQIQNEVQQNSADKQKTQRETRLLFQEIQENQECVDWINIIEVRYQGYVDFLRQKLSNYLVTYIKEHVVGKELAIASKEMAYKLAVNIIARQREGRLFEFAQRKYQRFIGDQLWRLYLNHIQQKRDSKYSHRINKK